MLLPLELLGDDDSTALKIVAVVAAVVDGDDDAVGDGRCEFGGVEVDKVQANEVQVQAVVNQLILAVILIHLCLCAHLMNYLRQILHYRLDWVVESL